MGVSPKVTKNTIKRKGLGLHLMEGNATIYKLGIAGLLFTLSLALFPQHLPAASTRDESFHQLQLHLMDTLTRGDDAGDILARLKSAPKPSYGVPDPAGSTAADELSAALKTFQRLAEAAIADGLRSDSAGQALVDGYDALLAAHLLFIERFDTVHSQVTGTGLSQEQYRRSAMARKRYGDAISPVFADLKDTLGETFSPKRFEDEGFRNKTLKSLRVSVERLSGIQTPRAPRILRNSTLPYRQPLFPARAPVTSPVIVPSYNTTEDTVSPEPADLAASPGVQLNGEILQKAKELEYDYIRIYKFVRDEIKTEWYAGSMKGAVGTLRQLSGNDIDQANLLIALFRASGLPSRYVHGVIDLPVESVMQSLGLSDPALAVNAVSRAGIAFAPQIRGGKVASLQLEYTWVSAYVPYTNYRGAMVDESGKTWVPLAPAVKGYNIVPAKDLLGGIDYASGNFIEEFLGAPQGLDPLGLLRKRIVDALQANSPDTDYDASLGSLEPDEDGIGLLPNTLPVDVVAVTGETPSLKTEEQQRIRFIVRQGTDGASAIVLDHTVPVSEVAGHRLTMSYMPATVEDQKTVNLFGGLDYVPAYLVKLRPQVKLDGRLLAVAADAVDMGREHVFSLQVLSPNGEASVSQIVVAGSYHAIGVSAQDSVPQYTTDDPADTEYMAARLLNSVVQTYTRRWGDAEDELASLHRVALVRPLPSVAVVSNAYKVDTFMDQPYQIHWEGVTIDAAMRTALPLSQESDPQAPLDWMRLAALQGSSLEHRTFQELFLVESISADKGVQLARSQGMTIHHIDSTNVDAVLPTLSHPENVKTDIANWVRLGMNVDVPDGIVTHEGWQGSVWRVEETQTGAAGYFIAGGLAGGSSTTPPEGWLLEWLQQALSNANSPSGNSDPLAAASISVISASNWQEGVVGEELGQALTVLVRDAAGRPVVSAPVTFSPALGGGQLIVEQTVVGQDGTETTVETTTKEPVIVLTGDNGIASVRYELGTDISASSSYTYRNDGDEFPTRTGYNIVDVAVKTHSGMLPSAYPFELLAYPGAPVSLVRTSKLYLGSPFPDSPRDYVNVQVQDQYGNVISNAPINFELAQSSPRSGGSSGHLDNGSLTKNIRTTANGAATVVYLGSGFFSYTLTASVQGQAIPPYSNSYSLSIPSGVVFTYMDFHGPEGQNLAAAKAGTTFEPTIRTELKCFDSETNSWGPASVQSGSIYATNGGSTSGAVVVGNSWQSTLTTSSTPAINSVIFQTPGVTCTPDNPDSYHPLSYNILTVYSLEPSIKNVFFNGQLVGPDGALESIYLNEEGTTDGTVKLAYATDPDTYKSLHTDIDILKGGVWDGIALGTTNQSNGTATLQRSKAYEADKRYEAQIVFNRGSELEVKSDPFRLPLRQKIFKDYTRHFRLSKDVDLINQRSCELGSEFEFTLTQPAKISLIFTSNENTNAKTTLLNNETYPAGTHSIDVDVTDLVPGTYTFEMTGVSDLDGHSERVLGTASSSFSTKQVLPVGATIVKGVNVSDGSLAVSVQDIDKIPGRGIPLEFSRTYSSGSNGEPGALGYGWHHNFDSKVIITRCGEAVVIGGQGGGMRFVEDGQGGLKPLKGYHGTLIANHDDQTFDFYAKDGTRYHYRNYGTRAEWNLEYILDTNGNITRLSYDPSDREFARLSTVQDAAGRTLAYRWEERNFPFTGMQPVIVGVTGPDGIEVMFEYDENGNLLAAKRENDARTEQYSYYTDNNLPFALQHKLHTRTNPLGGVTSYTYNERQWNVSGGGATYTWPMGFIVSVAEPEGGTTTFDYDEALIPALRTNRATDARGNTTAYTVNQYGAVTVTQDPVGTTTTTWMADDILMESRTDANGVTTAYTYDEDGNLLTESVEDTTAGITYTLARTYLDFPDKPWIKNRVAGSTDRNNKTTTFEYDANGNRTAVLDPEGNTNSSVYGANGDLIRTVDPLGSITRFSYDANGYPESRTDALGNTTTIEWNERGLRTATTDARGHTTSFTYDTLNNLIVSEDALGNEQRFSYNAAGDKTSETDEEERTTYWTYDRQSRVTAITNALGDEKRIVYDGVGNKTSETDWQNNITGFDYDAANRLITRTEPLERVTHITYDPVGNKKSVTDALGRVTRYDYDALNRAVTITDAAGNASHVEYDGENKTADIDALGRRTEYSYDGNNRLVQQTEPLGRTTRYEYDKNGNKVSETDALKHQRLFVYDALNRLLRRTDAEGNSINIEYDANGNVTKEIDQRLHDTRHVYDELNRRVSTIDPADNQTTFAYDRVGNKTGETLTNGNILSYGYDALNRLTESHDTLGPLSAFTYDANGNTLTETDANGNVSGHTYDALNRLVQSDLPEQRTVKFSYDPVGNKLSETDPNGNTTAYDYDALNRLVTVTDPLSRTVSYTYDAVGNTLTETDKRGNTTTDTYDDLNQPVTVTDPLGQVITTTYDLVGNKSGETDKRGTVSAFAYDKENRLTKTVKDGITLETNKYDEAGNLEFRTDALGNIVTWLYDERNRVVKESRPLAAITNYTYDAMGDRLTERDPEGRVTAWSYDLRRRTASETDGEGNTTEFAYDGKGNRTERRRPNGNTWTYAFDAADRLVAITDPLGGTTAYGYDGNGNTLNQTDANGNTTGYTYDALNRKTATTYADGAEESYSYDENGNRTGLTDAKGQRFSYEYDALNRETRRVYPTPAVSSGDYIVDIVTAYDANNNPVSHTESYSGTTGARITAKRYDTFDRLVAVTDAFGKTIGYGYDKNGNRTSLTDPDGKVTRYSFDELNRLVGVTTAGGITTYAYDRSSLITRVVYPNGSEALSDYDKARRTLSRHNRQGTNTVSRYDYSYDANGNRTQQIEENGAAAETTTYTFDANDRLTRVNYPDAAVSYTYDAAYNRTGESATDTASGNAVTDKVYNYNSRNQLTGISDNLDSTQSVIYQYDANGNQVIKSKNGVVTTFVYDTRDQLVIVRQDATTLGQFRYDYQGLRVEKTGADGLIRYSYDGDSVLTQSDEANQTLAKYEYGPDRLLSLNHSTEGRQFYLFDALGSVSNLTRPDGTLQARYQYDAWGNTRSTAGSSFNAFGFTGHEKDDETGLYYFKARFYDPDTGRFLSQDAYLGEVGTPPSLHRYLYAYGNPTVYVDLTGYLATVAENELNNLYDSAMSGGGFDSPSKGMRALIEVNGLGDGLHKEWRRDDNSTLGARYVTSLDPNSTRKLLSIVAKSAKGDVMPTTLVVREADESPEAATEAAGKYFGDYVTFKQRLRISRELQKSPGTPIDVSDIQDRTTEMAYARATDTALHRAYERTRQLNAAIPGAGPTAAAGEVLGQVDSFVTDVRLHNDPFAGENTKAGARTRLSVTAALAATPARGVSRVGAAELRGEIASANEVFRYGDEIVQQVAREQYQAGFQYLKQYMTPKEIRAYLADPANGQRFVGHATHRATDATLQKMHPGRFDYNPTRDFDFTDKFTGQAIELTTQKGVKTHQKRWADIVTYK